MMSAPLPTVIIGSGNVASALAPALEQAGIIDVKAVYSPTPAHAAALAAKLSHAKAVSHVSQVPADAAFYLFAVRDSAISTLATELPPVPQAIVAHTSGGVDASALAPLSPHFGVFYPLQTFSLDVAVNIAEVPFFIEASDAATLRSLRSIAEAISTKVYEASSATRSRLHAAAVFACNFTNHMWAIADDILRRETGTDISVLAPLLTETLRKAAIVSPASAQTGPAIRADLPVMQRHLDMLTPREADIYTLLSRDIARYHNVTLPDNFPSSES